MWKLVHGVLRRDRKVRSKKSVPKEVNPSPATQEKEEKTNREKELEEKMEQYLKRMEQIVESLVNMPVPSPPRQQQKSSDFKAIEVDTSIIQVEDYKEVEANIDIEEHEENSDNMQKKADKLKKMLKRRKEQ